MATKIYEVKLAQYNRRGDLWAGGTYGVTARGMLEAIRKATAKMVKDQRPLKSRPIEALEAKLIYEVD